MSDLSTQARDAIRTAFEQANPVVYLRTLAERHPATFCELLATVLAEEVSGALVLEEALGALEGARP